MKYLRHACTSLDWSNPNVRICAGGGGGGLAPRTPNWLTNAGGLTDMYMHWYGQESSNGIWKDAYNINRNPGGGGGGCRIQDHPFFLNFPVIGWYIWHNTYLYALAKLITDYKSPKSIITQLDKTGRWSLWGSKANCTESIAPGRHCNALGRGGGGGACPTRLSLGILKWGSRACTQIKTLRLGGGGGQGIWGIGGSPHTPDLSTDNRKRLQGM